jgi:hypothetical protein
MIRRVLEDADRIVYALVSEKIDRDALEVDYLQHETVTYRKATKSLEFVDGADREKISQLFNRYRETLTANHLRGLVRAALDRADPVSVRAGLLFVPRAHRRLLESVATFVGGLDPRASLGTLGVVDSQETRATLLGVVRRELEAELDAAKRDLDALLTEEGVRPTTLAQRLEGFRRVKAKTQGYAELLAFSSQELVRRVADLEERVKEAL